MDRRLLIAGLLALFTLQSIYAWACPKYIALNWLEFTNWSEATAVYVLASCFCNTQYIRNASFAGGRALFLGGDITSICRINCKSTRIKRSVWAQIQANEACGWDKGCLIWRQNHKERGGVFMIVLNCATSKANTIYWESIVSTFLKGT